MLVSPNVNKNKKNKIKRKLKLSKFLYMTFGMVSPPNKGDLDI